MSNPGKPVPINLTARVAGNSVLTLPEDAVANCYPGLELDVRNFDRRFFPGLVFEFVSAADPAYPVTNPNDLGARLAYVDADQDPEVTPDLYGTLSGSTGIALQQGNWYIETLIQPDKTVSKTINKTINKTISTRGTPNPDGTFGPLDGMTVWRLVRSLTPGPVTITLLRRDSPTGQSVTLSAQRRYYTDPTTGAISLAYQPGELGQSLCSPWQHDFRDCYCHYWAANHPDLVFGEIRPGEPTLPGGLADDPVRANTRLDWLRADRSRSRAAAAQESYPLNRPFQLDHYQINAAWKQLPVVINDIEQGECLRPAPVKPAEPLGSPQALVNMLAGTLAGLEMALALEYIYARDSLLTPAEVTDDTAAKWPQLADHLAFARQALLLTAVSEMQHLRLVNEMLWRLYQKQTELGITGNFVPALEPATEIPNAGRNDTAGHVPMRDAKLRLLKPEVLQEFINVEYPSATIDGAYASVAETLRQDLYEDNVPDLLPIAERIAAEGMEHESRFRFIQTVFAPYKEDAGEYPYLRNEMLPGQATDEGVKDALAIFTRIKDALCAGYKEASDGDLAGMGGCVIQARGAMTELLAKSADLAKQNIGVPYF